MLAGNTRDRHNTGANSNRPSEKMKKSFLIIAILSGLVGFFFSDGNHMIKGAAKALLGVFMCLWFIVTLIEGLEHSDSTGKH